MAMVAVMASVMGGASPAAGLWSASAVEGMMTPRQRERAKYLRRRAGTDDARQNARLPPLRAVRLSTRSSLPYFDELEPDLEREREREPQLQPQPPQPQQQPQPQAHQLPPPPPPPPAQLQAEPLQLELRVPERIMGYPRGVDAARFARCEPARSEMPRVPRPFGSWCRVLVFRLLVALLAVVVCIMINIK